MKKKTERLWDFLFFHCDSLMGENCSHGECETRELFDGRNIRKCYFPEEIKKDDNRGIIKNEKNEN